MSSTQPAKISAPMKFKFKGDKNDKKHKKKSHRSSKDKPGDQTFAVVEEEVITDTPPTLDKGDADSEDEYLTAAQLKQKKKSQSKEKDLAKHNATVSYRERIAIFNEKLATASEHNDIPRVSAAGNG